MIAATLYIVQCTARNRLRARLARLRQPRYLFGALVGAAYLYLTIFARRRSTRRRTPRSPAESAATLSAIVAGAPPVLATALLGIAVLAWAVPVDTGLVTFSDAEVDFLFTAPVTRRQLLLHRLVRGQIGLLVGAAVAMFVYPSLSAMSRLRTSIALWLLLLTMRVYATAVMQARRSFAASEPRLKRAAWAPLAVIAGAAIAVGTGLVRAFLATPAGDLPAGIRVVHGVATAGLASCVLVPFVALVRPLFATGWDTWLGAIGPALLVFAVAVAWLVRIDELFYATDGQATTTTTTERRTPIVVARRAPWRLAPVGRPEMAFTWRAAVAIVRGSGTASVRPMIAVAAITVGVLMSSRQRGLAQMLMVFASLAAFAAVVLGPQMLRIDLRQDLRHIDVLKTWPVRAPQVVRGEILLPSMVLTVLGWTAIAVVLITSGALFARYALTLRAAVAAAAGIVAPALIAAQLTIHNAAALAFPGWIPTGAQRPRGLDALGQRLILVAGTLMLLALATAPGAAAGAAVWFAFRRMAGAASLVAAALVCAAVIAVELIVATEAMGPLYDGVDLSEIERPET